MELFDYLMAKNSQNTGKDLFSYLLGKNAGESGTYTTFSGTSINISNTIKAKLKNFMLNSTELTQDGTPTPDTPQDIHVITGSNNIKIQNKNLALNDDTNNPDANYESAGVGSNAIQYDTNEQGLYTTTSRARFFKLEEGKTYTFSLNAKYRTAGNAHYIYYYYYNSTTEKTTAVQGSIGVSQSDSYNRYSKTFTIPNGYDAFRIVVYNGLYFKDIQLEEGSTASDYVEHQEQNYPITLSSDNLLNLPTKLVEVAKNGLTFTPVYIGNALLYINVNGTATADTDYYVVNTSNRLTLSAGSYLFSSGVDGSNNTYFMNFSARNLSVISNYSGNTSLTINNSDGFWFLIKVRNGTTVDNVKFKPFLRVSTSTSEYAPYIPNPIEYCKIGDYADQFFKNTTDSEFYESTLELNEWYLKKNTMKIVRDGNGGWNFHVNAAGNNNFYYSSALAKNVVNSSLQKCNMLKYAALNYNYGGNQTFEIGRGNVIITSNNFANSDELNAFLNENPLIFHVPISVPEYIHISETDYPTLRSQLENIYNNAKSYNGQTYITQTNEDLPFNISVDVKVSSVNLGMSNSLNTSLLNENTTETQNIVQSEEQTNLDDTNKIEESIEEYQEL